MDAGPLTTQLKSTARRLGFTLSGACPAVTPTGFHQLATWLEQGYAGQMDYLAKRHAAYRHPGSILTGVRSLLVLGLNYRSLEPSSPQSGAGRVSRYAWSDHDYHDIIHERLRELADELRALVPAARVRGVVDTAPLFEREFAQLAGLGWIGKHTLLIHREAGSWFFLAALLTDVTLDYDLPFTADHCGSCTACLEACPTQAFPQPHVLDASRCISYLTIEHRGPIPAPLRAGLGSWVFGCDVCQDVCPWNRRAPASDESIWRPRPWHDPLPLAELFTLDDAMFRERFRHTPLWRPQRRGILRNAAIALGNQRAADTIHALAIGLADHEPVVRGAAAWALGRIGTAEAVRLLHGRRTVEADDEVLGEIAAALEPHAAPAAETNP